MIRIDELRARHREEALQRGINPRDVDVLLSDLTGRSLAWVFAHGEERVDESRLVPLLARRYAGEPLQYIRGKVDFYSREFFVDDRVLIPRPETELVVEAAIDLAPRGGRVIDIGTGSGCIARSIELERPDLSVFGVDVSLASLAVARRNGVRRLAASNVLDAISGHFDVIVSNPPYIASGEIGSLQIEVRKYEPYVALTPGPRGTEVIEQILADAPRVLMPGGRIIMEIGFGQENAMRAIATDYRIERFIDDLAGIPRVIVLSADAE